MPKPTKADAIRAAAELLALDVKARENGTSLVDLLSIVAKQTYGVDVRPTVEEIEDAQEPEEAALELAPADPAEQTPPPAA